MLVLLLHMIAPLIGTHWPLLCVEAEAEAVFVGLVCLEAGGVTRCWKDTRCVGPRCVLRDGSWSHGNAKDKDQWSWKYVHTTYQLRNMGTYFFGIHSCPQALTTIQPTTGPQDHLQLCNRD